MDTARDVRGVRWLVASSLALALSIVGWWPGAGAHAATFSTAAVPAQSQPILLAAANNRNDGAKAAARPANRGSASNAGSAKAKPVRADSGRSSRSSKPKAASSRAGSAKSARSAGSRNASKAGPVAAKSNAKGSRKVVAASAPSAKRASATARQVATRRATSGRRSEARTASSKSAKKATVRQRAVGRPSIAEAFGLRNVVDPLALHSSVALVFDPRDGEVLYAKNPGAVLPIASITKLMTAMVILDAELPGNEMIRITDADVDRERFSGSRLAPGVRLSRLELLQLALMASENRAAHALGRTYPGGLEAFTSAMNAKAQLIGMSDSQFVEPTGLSSANVSTARDLARLVTAAFEYPMIRQYSTASALTVDTGYRQLAFHNTNRLVSSSKWDISLQKTGYISEAGRCLVMQTRIDGAPVGMVLLDSTGRNSRYGDAQRIRKWLESERRETVAGAPAAAG